MKALSLTVRPLRDLPLEERQQILLSLQVESNRVVRARHNISSNTIGHLRWHYGGSKRGSFHKDILAGARHEKLMAVQSLKERGLNSKQVANDLGLPLELVNKIWI